MDPSTSSPEGGARASTPPVLPLALAALGVVYGDIGTSPLYALRECFGPEHGIAATPANVLGVLSLVFWALTVTISVKYLAYVLLADNRGEGGVLALMSLVPPRRERSRGALVALGLLGAALLYGDGMITPAISVLSAVEGLAVASPQLGGWVQPLAMGILVAVFMVQSRGTASVGRVFGPITLVWFVALAGLGVRGIAARPDVLAAINPVHAFRFFLANGWHGFLALGAVCLVVTGGEALYADMGHFGRSPIRWAWFVVVLPALLLNYFGQGALILGNPGTASNPFYLLAPAWALVPMIVLATAATIIASQAVISGAFSLTRQAAMLGFWPRTRIEHTSADQIGQIYVPAINWMLMLATLGLVVGFGTSGNLAAAYGIAVTLTMVITTLLAWRVARYRWGWSALQAGSLTLVLAVVDLALFAACATKIAHGGWFPLAVAAALLLLMLTWRDGRRVLGERIRAGIVPLADFWELIRVERPARVPGTAVFMCSNAEGAPPALVHNFTHNRVVHQRNVLLTVTTLEQARVDEAERLEVAELDEGFVRVVARFGFMEVPDVPALLKQAALPGVLADHTSYFLGRETLLPRGKHGLSTWREQLFAVLARNAQPATAFFRIPPDRVLEVGTQIEL